MGRKRIAALALLVTTAGCPKEQKPVAPAAPTEEAAQSLPHPDAAEAQLRTDAQSHDRVVDTEERIRVESIVGGAPDMTIPVRYPQVVAVGCRGRDGPSPLPAEAAPRTDPSERHYRTGLPPWVLA